MNKKSLMLLMVVVTILLSACGNKHEIEEKLRLGDFKEVKLSPDEIELEEVLHEYGELKDHRVRVMKVEDGTLYAISTDESGLEEEKQDRDNYFIKIEDGKVEKVLMDENIGPMTFELFGYEDGSKFYGFFQDGSNNLFSFDYEDMKLEDLGRVDGGMDDGISYYIYLVKDDKIYYEKRDDDGWHFDIHVYDMVEKTSGKLEIDFKDYNLERVSITGINYHDGQVYYENYLSSGDSSSEEWISNIYELDLETGKLDLILEDLAMGTIFKTRDGVLFADVKLKLAKDSEKDYKLNSIFAGPKEDGSLKYGINIDREYHSVGMMEDRYVSMISEDDDLIILDLEGKLKYKVEFKDGRGINKVIKDEEDLYVSIRGDNGDDLYRVRIDGL